MYFINKKINKAESFGVMTPLQIEAVPEIKVLSFISHVSMSYISICLWWMENIPE